MLSIKMQGLINNINDKIQSKNKNLMNKTNKNKHKERVAADIVAFDSFCNDTPLQQYSNPNLNAEEGGCNDNINYSLFFNQTQQTESTLIAGCENINSSSLPIRETSLMNDNLGDNLPQFGSSCSQSTSAAMGRKRKDSVFLHKPAKTADKYEQFFDDTGTTTNQPSRASLPTVLLLLVVCLVFVVLPVVYLLHCFDFLLDRTRWDTVHDVSWQRMHQSKDEVHYSPSILVHQQLDRPDLTASVSDMKYHDHNNLHTKNRPLTTAPSMVKSTRKQKTRKVLPLPPLATADSCSVVSDDRRFDCYPENGVSQEACTKRGCCWAKPHDKEARRPMSKRSEEQASLNVPYCFYPSQYGGYAFVNATERAHGVTVYLKRTFRSPYPKDIAVIKMDVKFENENRLHIKITDPTRSRFEPPYPEVPLADKTTSDTLYRFDVDQNKTGFKVIRRDDNVTIFDAQDVGAFIFSDQFLQLSGVLPGRQLFGLGEHRGPLLIGSDWQQLTLFNHDQAPTEHSNLYGSHPFYLLMEDSGKSHGVFLLNSNAMDVVVQPTPAITFRPIGGVFSLYFFLGPTPAQVLRQYTDIIGRPHMPPYWALGFHLCKYGYGSLNHTKEVWQRTREAGIPFDVQWNDLDYMDRANDFTYDRTMFEGLPEFVRMLHGEGMHYVPLIDPGVSAAEEPGQYPPYDMGVDMGIFVKNASGQPFVGKVWNKVSTVWPDFTHPKTVDYWTTMLSNLHKEIGFDGAWIDMNEPSNFLSGALDTGCPMNSSLEFPPYLPGVFGGQLSRNTLCMTAQHHAGAHYDVHNLYALSEAIVTSFALAELRGKRPFVISRASFPGLGRYAGHWSGDIASTWYDMKQTLPELLRFSLLGIPLMGADICGFNGNTTEELCLRWMQLGAFYPFSRNHNSDSSLEQDPVALGPAVVAASINALTIRYALVPYLYTLFHRAHVYGDTVARPLFVEFPWDEQARTVQEQFLWGPAVMIAPALNAEQMTVQAYLPAGVWYDWYLHSQIISAGAVFPLEAPLDIIPLLVRGGHILALAPPRTSTIAARRGPFGILAAADENGDAVGEMYWDDGDSLNSYEEKRYTLIQFHLAEGSLKISAPWCGYTLEPLVLEDVRILGVNASVTRVTINQTTGLDFSYDTINKFLLIQNVNVSMENSISIAWE